MVDGGTLALVPNAMDHVAAPVRAESNGRAMNDLHNAGVQASELDLRDYFGREGYLRDELASYSGVWVRGGNAFVLRRAMRLSGFDGILPSLLEEGFLYAGYSAGPCVLAPSLEGIGRVDEPELDPHGFGSIIWEGLGILPYLVLPHYRSDHFESEAIEEEVEYCKKHDIPFRTLRDGEVIVIDDPTSDLS
jgi:dipeptidase E